MSSNMRERERESARVCVFSLVSDVQLFSLM